MKIVLLPATDRLKKVHKGQEQMLNDICHIVVKDAVLRGVNITETIRTLNSKYIIKKKKDASSKKY